VFFAHCYRESGGARVPWAVGRPARNTVFCWGGAHAAFVPSCSKVHPTPASLPGPVKQFDRLMADARKYPNADREWRWQFAFPQEHRWVNPRTGEQGRHHVHESLVQKAGNQAAGKARLTKRVTSHTAAVRSPHTYWPMATTSAPSRNCWATAM